VAEWHLEQIKLSFESNGLQLVKEKEGDDYSISGIWEVVNLNGKLFELEFEGLGELEVLPMHKSYAVHIKEEDVDGLYLSKHKPSSSKLNAMKIWEKT